MFCTDDDGEMVVVAWVSPDGNTFYCTNGNWEKTPAETLAVFDSGRQTSTDFMVVSTTYPKTRSRHRFADEFWQKGSWQIVNWCPTKVKLRPATKSS